MGPADFIAIGIILVVVGCAVAYIVKAKKSGKTARYPISIARHKTTERARFKTFFMILLLPSSQRITLQNSNNA